MTCASALGRACLVLGLASAPLPAAEWQGEVALEARAFTQSGTDPRQDQFDLALLGEISGFHDANEGRDRFALNIRGRLDDRDAERNLADLSEAFYRRRWRSAEVLVGVDRVFWGVTEALHLVDVINQTDLAASPDSEDKLGQPMLRLSLFPDWGTWDAFILPRFRERTFPGSRGRLRGPLRIVADNPGYESSREAAHVDFALRYSHYVGPLEFALSHFSGTSRLPVFTALDGTPLPVSPEALTDPLLLQQAAAGLRPFYYLTDQSGLEATLVAGAWLWKLEAIRGRDPRGRFRAATGGFEFTLNGLGGRQADLGLIVEYQYDTRPAELLVTSDDDWVVGARLALNDFAGSEVLVLASRDRRTRSGALVLEASRRIGNSWRIAAEARYFEAGDGTDALTLFDREDYWQLSLTRFF